MQIIHVGGRIVNAYLYPADDGYVLVDTGYSGGFPRFLRRLRRAGVEVEAISWVFLTHAHDDHAASSTTCCMPPRTPKWFCTARRCRDCGGDKIPLRAAVPAAWRWAFAAL